SSRAACLCADVEQRRQVAIATEERDRHPAAEWRGRQSRSALADAPSTIIQAAPRSTIWNWAIGLVKLRLQGAEYSDDLAVHPDEREDVRHRIEIPVIAGHHLSVTSKRRMVKKPSMRAIDQADIVLLPSPPIKSGHSRPEAQDLRGVRPASWHRRPPERRTR